MKIIDLLNKIANKEELPQKIMFHNMIWNKESDLDYYTETIHTYLFYNRWDLTNILNDEVEIIEEEKEIPEKLDYPHIEIESSADDEIRDYLYKVKDKFDEILDYLKSKGE